MTIKIKLKKGDEVIVLAGKDKGKTGKIIKVIPKQMKAIVSEINKVKNNENMKIIFSTKVLIELANIIDDEIEPGPAINGIPSGV